MLRHNPGQGKKNSPSSMYWTMAQMGLFKPEPMKLFWIKTNWAGTGVSILPKCWNLSPPTSPGQSCPQVHLSSTSFSPVLPPSALPVSLSCPLDASLTCSSMDQHTSVCQRPSLQECHKHVLWHACHTGRLAQATPRAPSGLCSEKITM